jgi:hypothetical protein
MDMEVHPRDDDLVIGTHARGFFVLDDVTPLRALAGALRQAVTLFPLRPATRYIPANDTSSLAGGMFVAPNKPYGAALSYFLARAPEDGGHVEVTILDSAGGVVRTLTGGKRAGVNRIAWDLRRTGCIPSQPGTGRVAGPRVAPGKYMARLTALGHTVEQSFVVRLDPRVDVTTTDLTAHAQAIDRLVRMECNVSEALGRIAAVETQLTLLEQNLADGTLSKVTSEVRRQLRDVADRFESDPRGPAPLNLSRKISKLRQEIEGYTGRPTAAQLEWIEIFGRQLNEVVAALERVFTGSVATLNQQLSTAGIPHIIVPRGKG